MLSLGYNYIYPRTYALHLGHVKVLLLLNHEGIVENFCSHHDEATACFNLAVHQVKKSVHVPSA